jgi:hypothetical protein
MEPGYLLDQTRNSVEQTKWIEGAPVPQLFLGLKVGLQEKGRTKLAVTTFRCTSCGFLESYAKPDAP